MYKRRQIFNGLENESCLFWGARQTGKSTLLKSTYPNAIYIDLLLSHEYGKFLRDPGQLREIGMAVKAGDKIISIDGKSMEKKTTEEVSDALKGPKGTSFELVFERINEGNKTVKITRDEIKAQVESLMVELVGLRALYDFLVVCDESNNTPARIDRNELYVDIAIEPVKAVEFIYIPLRIKNTGEIAGL